MAAEDYMGMDIEVIIFDQEDTIVASSTCKCFGEGSGYEGGCPYDG